MGWESPWVRMGEAWAQGVRVESLQKGSLGGWGRGMSQAGIHFINIMALNPGGVVEPLGGFKRTLSLGPTPENSD